MDIFSKGLYISREMDCIWWVDEYSEIDITFRQIMDKLIALLIKEEYEKALLEIKNTITSIKSSFKQLILLILGGNCAIVLNKLNEAEGFYIQALQITNNPFLIEHFQEEAMEARGAILGNMGVVFKNKKDLKMANKYFEDSLKILSGFGTSFAERKDFNKAIEFTQVALQIAEEMKLELFEGMAHLNIGSFLVRSGHVEEAFKSYERAQSILHKLQNPHEATVLAAMGAAYDQRGRPDKFLEYIKKATDVQIQFVKKELKNLGKSDLERAQNLAKTIDRYIRGLVDVCLELREYAIALQYYWKLLDIYKKVKYEGGEVYVLATMAGLYYYNGNFKDSIKYYQKTLKLINALVKSGVYPPNKFKEEEGICLKGLDSTYVLKKEYNKALGYAQKALEVYRILNDKKMIAPQLGHIKELCLLIGDLSSAEKYESERGQLISEAILEHKNFVPMGSAKWVEMPDGKKVKLFEKDGQFYLHDKDEAVPQKVDLQMMVGDGAVSLGDLAKSELGKKLKLVGFLPGNPFDSEKKKDKEKK